MDEQSKERLARIIASDKDVLLKEDLDFLRARRSYLNDEQRMRFADELNEEGVELSERRTKKTKKN